jgi:pimeloyl-ACP methyl ester carboxylesterase
MATRSCSGTVYELSGPEEAPTVVLVHGLGLNRHIWQWHEPTLAADYRVLRYDLWGHGDSVPPVEKPSLSLFSSQLFGLLDELGIGLCTVVGFSLGGMINRRFAMDHPERVRGLAVLNSPHERSPAAQKTVEERAAKTAAGGPGATLDVTIERWFTPAFRATRPEVIAQVRQWVVANEPAVYTQCRQVLAKGVTELIRPEPPIRQPTLVMTAENDSGSTPAMTRAIAAEIPGARTVIIAHLQHMALVESPSQFVEPLLQFLSDLPATLDPREPETLQIQRMRCGQGK